MIKKIASLTLLAFLSSAMFLFAGNVPDTGQTGDYLFNTFGEDSDYTIHPPSYTKLDASGHELPDSAAAWIMVRDNVTGLIWENKTDDGSIHDWENTYTFDWPDCEGEDCVQKPKVPDFLAALNTTHFGGFSDWRLPTLKELSALIDNSINPGDGNPSINQSYFPYTAATSDYFYWTSTVQGYFAWGVDFYRASLSQDSIGNRNWVRAVRGGKPENTVDRFIDFTEPGTANYTAIRDTATGLMWEKRGPSSKMTWEAAIKYCEDLSLGFWVLRGAEWVYYNYDDWRLPNWKELQSIVNYSLNNPAIDGSLFIGPPVSIPYWNYWSSTTNPYNGDAWAIHYGAGTLESRNKNWSQYNSYVRCVRGGQCGPLGDSDGDGICDDGDESGVIGDNSCNGVDKVWCDDNCPNGRNPDQADANDNGIGDWCDAVFDSDGDGIPDDLDGCPYDPQKANPGVCGCGVSDIDSDGDGKQDCIDSCPNSNRGATISIGSCNTGVSNQLSSDGCTMSDIIAHCAAGTKNHGVYVSCVAYLTNEWESNGVITGKGKGDIQSCAAKAK